MYLEGTGWLTNQSSFRKIARVNNLVEAHCYGKGKVGQFLSEHIAIKQVEG